jgi:hypothetical protein
MFRCRRNARAAARVYRIVFTGNLSQISINYVKEKIVSSDFCDLGCSCRRKRMKVTHQVLQSLFEHVGAGEGVAQHVRAYLLARATEPNRAA